MKENYIYMDCKVKMSKNSLYLLTYAAIITKTDLQSFFGVGIYNLDTKKNGLASSLCNFGHRNRTIFIFCANVLPAIRDLLLQLQKRPPQVG